MVFLVGGFSASPWLLARLKMHLNKDNINISRPDTHMFVPLPRYIFNALIFVFF